MTDDALLMGFRPGGGPGRAQSAAGAERLPCRARWRNVARMEGLSQETLAVIGAAIALAGLILRQGSHIDKRFEEVDKRFEEVDKRFEQVDKRFEQIDKRFEQLEERLSSVEKETSRISGLLEGLGLSGRLKSTPSGSPA